MPGKTKRWLKFSYYGYHYAHLGDLKNAELQFTDTISTYCRIEDKKGIMDAYNELARIYFIRSDYNRASGYLGMGKSEGFDLYENRYANFVKFLIFIFLSEIPAT